MRNPLKPKMALVLGGGGARGVAHLGVLKVLDDAGLSPDLIVGCSAGAFMGVLYALTGNVREAEERLLSFTESSDFDSENFDDLQAIAPLDGEGQGFFARLKRVYKTGRYLTKTLFKESYIGTDEFDNNVDGILPDDLLENARVPIVIVATDLSLGREVVLRSGPARTAVKASSAIAGIFPPVEINGRQLIDGGFVDKVPVETALHLGADVVIAVDVSAELEDTKEFSHRGTIIATRASAILSATSKNLQLRFADVIIRPDIQEIHWADFAASREIIPLGESAARDMLPEIRRAIRRGYPRRIKRFFTRHPSRKVFFGPYEATYPPEKSAKPPTKPPTQETGNKL